MRVDSNNKSKPFINIKKDHWEKNWQYGVSMRPLSLLNVFNRDAIALLSEPLRSIAHPTIVEIGFVPGKYLRFFEKHFNAKCHGYDYSEQGCSQAHQFFREQGGSIQVYCQDVLTKLPNVSHGAHLVYSIGVVEHFEDPVGMISAHLAPLADDGVAIIILPNYQDLNRWIQKRLDSENLAIHNLDSMTAAFWEHYAEQFPEFEFKTRQFGRLNPWMFSFWRLGKVGHLLQLFLNFGSFLLPKRVKIWASMFIIEVRRR